MFVHHAGTKIGAYMIYSGLAGPVQAPGLQCAIIHLSISALGLYKLFVCLFNFLTYFLLNYFLTYLLLPE